MTFRLGRVTGGLMLTLAVGAFATSAASAAPLAPRQPVVFVHRAASGSLGSVSLQRSGVRWLIALNPKKALGYTSERAFDRALTRRTAALQRTTRAHASSGGSVWFFSDIGRTGCYGSVPQGWHSSDLRSVPMCSGLSWNDQISSVSTYYMVGFYTMLYRDINYGGGSIALAPGYRYDDLRFGPWYFNDLASSIKVCPC